MPDPTTSPAAAADLPWRVEHRRGTAAELHHADVPTQRSVLVLEVTHPALVLGSTQPEHVVDHDAMALGGVQLARRRSGGGAVLLVPGEHIWIDVVVPSGDPHWLDDVEAATWWLGAAWAEALGAAPGPTAGARGLGVHRRGVTDRELGRTACFAALGPGEVSADGRKVVGVAQRRSRVAARFQCVVHRHLDPRATWRLLAPSLRTAHLLDVLERGVGDLDRLGVDPGWDVVEGLAAHLG